MLNPSQKIAVECTEWPLLIVAGAWAGKTHTLTERVGYMVKDLWIAPSSILCVTFTNKAAKEMKERIWSVLGVKGENISLYRSHDFPAIGTFHSIWVYFLRLFIDKIWYDKNFTIIDEDDKLKLIKEILEEKWIDSKEFGARPIAYTISNAKNNWHNAKMFSFNTKSYFEEKVSEVFDVYEKRMKSMSALDFDDILLKTNELLENAEILNYFHNRFKYFLVDEYQDTNEIQYRIINKLAHLSKNICVVGDDWQGIYSWRWANIQNIFNFQKDYKNSTVVKLEQNYRSTKTIVNAANTVIKHNQWIMDKTLWTDNIEWSKITLLETQDEKHESQAVSDEIEKIRDEREEENIAILYRTNGQSRLIEEALLSKWIPYRVFGWVKFYDRKEIKDILAYLRLVSNQNDMLAFKRIINVPARKIWAKSVETLMKYCNNYSISPIEIISNSDEISELTPQARKWVNSFKQIMDDVMEYSQDHSLDELLWYIVGRTDYEAYLLEEYWSEEYEGKMDNLKEFRNMAFRYSGMAIEESLRMFLEEIALITDADKAEDPKTSKVSLMTIHSSKWLEFENVFIMWAEEWIFPHSRSLQEPKELEEERRLMYVAMTRAKKHLFISRANERFFFGSYSANPRSRFLREIPPEAIEVKTLAKATSFWGFGMNFWWSGITFTNTPSEPTVATKRTIINNDPSKFSLWDKVKHIKFWVWTMVSISWNMADIAFSWYGIKKMNIEIAPLEKL
ncbi:MAG: ATP-dependent DNA helicase PcrA [uncultured bacterium (gcode 4)]|uniref:DNA 3'-5' helicase n=1 Tax=uncultured bacterium (gcode 4) TaxID=1234023 RepID=K2GII1_9BACT|nr:MAG: ATP-dependent DNA helicase PcrA [uncultured bacterium (gcode 4)]